MRARKREIGILGLHRCGVDGPPQLISQPHQGPDIVVRASRGMVPCAARAIGYSNATRAAGRVCCGTEKGCCLAVAQPTTLAVGLSVLRHPSAPPGDHACFRHSARRGYRAEPGERVPARGIATEILPGAARASNPYKLPKPSRQAERRLPKADPSSIAHQFCR